MDFTHTDSLGVSIKSGDNCSIPATVIDAFKEGNLQVLKVRLTHKAPGFPDTYIFPANQVEKS